MKYCPSCGKQWVNEAKFCAHCGFKRPFANEGRKNESKEESKEENNVNQDSAFNHTEKVVIQKSIEDPISDTAAKKNTYNSSLVKEKKSQSNSKQMNLLKGKRFILISIVFLLIVGISSFLLIANNKPKLSAKEKKEALETYKAYKEAQDYIKKNGYEDELTKGENEQSESIHSETASEEPSIQDNVSTSETVNTENSSTTEDTDNGNNSVTIEGTWNYPEMNQVFEISFIDDFNGMLKIKSQETSKEFPFQVINFNFEDGKLEINLENGGKWTLQRSSDDLYISKDDGSNMVLKAASKTK